MQYPVYWHGEGMVYIDYIFVESEEAEAVLQGDRDQEIADSLQPLLYGTGDSLVIMWRLAHEDLATNNYVTTGYVTELLKDAPGHAYGYAWHPHKWRAYVQVVQPDISLIYVYPIAHNTSYSSDYVGPDSVGLQDRLSPSFSSVKEHKVYIDEHVTDGSHLVPSLQTCELHINGVKAWRYPSGNEMCALINLCLAYGVDGIYYFTGGS